MIIDDQTETCRQCTLKHLSTALVALTDDTLSDIQKRVYFCGNLSHAANHFVHIDETLAEAVRALRIDAQNDRLEFIMPIQDIEQRLTTVIEQISKFDPPPPRSAEKITTVKNPATPTTTPQKRGCPCKNR